MKKIGDGQSRDTFSFQQRDQSNESSTRFKDLDDTHELEQRDHRILRAQEEVQYQKQSLQEIQDVLKDFKDTSYSTYGKVRYATGSLP